MRLSADARDAIATPRQVLVGAAAVLALATGSGAATNEPDRLLAPSALGIAFSTFLGRYDSPAAAGWDSSQAVAVDDQGFIYVAGIAQGSALLVRSALQPAPAGSQDAFLIKLSPDGSRVVFGTWLGGSSTDIAVGIAVDGGHNVYVAGSTLSTDFPTRGAHQPLLAGGLDAFVTKVSPDGDQLLYSTYLGGSFQDLATAIAVDAAGNAYVVGVTDSFDFPTHKAFIESSPDRNVSEDGFVARFAPDGSLVYSTLLGGTQDDFAYGVAVGADRAPVVVGQTGSADFPLRSALQPLLGDGPPSGVGDAFVLRLAADGRSLLFGTYLGGSAHDLAEGVALDDRGRVLVVGETMSPDFPTRQPLQATLRGESDAFIARLTADGRTLDRATYLGGTGSGPEPALDVAGLPDGGLVVLGSTWSADFPVRDPLQPAHAGQSDVFVTALPADMTSLAFGTFLGGSDLDPTLTLALAQYGSSAVAVGPTGAIVLATDTLSADFPTRNNISRGFPSGGQAAAVVKIDVVEPPPATAEVCRFLRRRAPPAAIADAMANPERVPGWGQLCQPTQPPGPLNFPRRWLSLQNIAGPYHVLGNALVFKCGCP